MQEIKKPHYFVFRGLLFEGERKQTKPVFSVINCLKSVLENITSFDNGNILAIPIFQDHRPLLPPT